MICCRYLYVYSTKETFLEDFAENFLCIECSCIVSISEQCQSRTGMICYDNVHANTKFVCSFHTTRIRITP